MTVSEAWLLDCGDSLTIAVGDHEMSEYLQQREQYTVPGSPGYCGSVMVWQNNIVPVMDLAALVTGNASAAGNSTACLLNYQEAPHQRLLHLAMSVTRAPQKIRVEDAYACDFPESIDSTILRQITLACFTHDDLPVLIIDIARLCSAEIRELALAA